MPSLVQCPNGHFFDRDKYSACPYCKGLTGKVDSAVDISNTVPLNTVPPGGNNDSTVALNVSTRPIEPTDNPTVDPDVTMIVHPDGADFVVGWLVAIEGPYKGKSFELHKGYNQIGRMEGDIRLQMDSTISRADHFRIIFDEEDNRFLFFAGKSDNYPRVNDEKKYDGERTELKAYAKIEAGKSKFLFIPLCSDRFEWPEHKKK